MWKENDPAYLFTSQRLGFRNWTRSDISKMSEINADKEVMAFFPGVASAQQTADFVKRMQKQFENKGFCYFAVDSLADGEFIGFTGLSEQNYEAHFTPCVDIGWRLKRTAWHLGYATEGAKRCLEYAFETLLLRKVNAVAPKINVRSEQVMKKTGMKKVCEFVHPLLIDDTRLKDCVLYEKINPSRILQ